LKTQTISDFYHTLYHIHLHNIPALISRHPCRLLPCRDFRQRSLCRCSYKLCSCSSTTHHTTLLAFYLHGAPQYLPRFCRLIRCSYWWWPLRPNSQIKTRGWIRGEWWAEREERVGEAFGGCAGVGGRIEGRG